MPPAQAIQIAPAGDLPDKRLAMDERIRSMTGLTPSPASVGRISLDCILPSELKSADIILVPPISTATTAFSGWPFLLIVALLESSTVLCRQEVQHELVELPGVLQLRH